MHWCLEARNGQPLSRYLGRLGPVMQIVHRIMSRRSYHSITCRVSLAGGRKEYLDSLILKKVWAFCANSTCSWYLGTSGSTATQISQRPPHLLLEPVCPPPPSFSSTLSSFASRGFLIKVLAFTIVVVIIIVLVARASFPSVLH
jgi:hypothetical protein